MADDNLSADSPERTYFLSADAAEDKRRSLPLIIYNRQCWTCRRKVEITRALSASAQYFLDVIVKHCSHEQDYLLPDTPMKEAIFRVLLAGGNKPVTADGVSEELSRRWAMTQFPRPTSPRVMRRLLDDLASGDYYCIVSSDSGYEYRKKLGESVKPPTCENPVDGGETGCIVSESDEDDTPTQCPPIVEPPPEPRPEDPGDPFERPVDYNS